MQSLSGVERLEAVQYQLDQYFKYVIPNIFHYVIAFMISNMALRNILIRWTGGEHDLYELNKSLPGNVTSEMGLELGDLADIARGFPEVENYLKVATDETFYKGLIAVQGGEQFKNAFVDFIDKYGSRCPGEIDLTRLRWREAPTQLIAAILGHIRSVETGEHRQRFIRGEQDATEAEQRVLRHVKRSWLKSKLVKRLIKVYRNLGGLREHHKFLLTLLLDECKRAIYAEAEELVKRRVLLRVEDANYFSIDELILLSKGQLKVEAEQLIAERKKRLRVAANLEATESHDKRRRNCYGFQKGRFSKRSSCRQSSVGRDCRRKSPRDRQTRRSVSERRRNSRCTGNGSRLDPIISVGKSASYGSWRLDDSRICSG